MIKIYIVRHGQTNWNEKGLMQGNTDITLNEIGLKQANKAKEDLKDIKFDICISSPLKRALETARIITDNRCKIILDDLLLERGMGDFEGKDYRLYKKYDFYNYEQNLSIYGVESIKALLNRTKIFLDKMKKEYQNKTVLIVSHAATIRSLHYNIIGYDKNTHFLDFKVENGECHKYEI